MFDLVAVDRVEVQILIDDATDPLSSVPPYAESEVGYLLRTGRLVEIAADRMCTAAHGICCLVTAFRGVTKHTLLFDTGPRPDILLENSQRLGVDLTALEAVVLSHGHIDHAGGLLAVLDASGARDMGRQVAVHTHADAFRQRAMALPSGTMVPLQDVPSREDLAAHGGLVCEATAPSAILDNMFVVSGEIPRTTMFETGFQGHYRRSEQDGAWEPDFVVHDERFLVTHVAGKGLVLFTGCSHAGIINVLRSACAECPDLPVHGVFGGLHLAGMTEPLIGPTIAALRSFEPKVLAVGHCTGWRAINAMTAEFGDAVVAPLAVGKRYVL